MWVWVNTYRYIFSGMNIHLPAILGFTRGTRFWPIPMFSFMERKQKHELNHSLRGNGSSQPIRLPRLSHHCLPRKNIATQVQWYLTCGGFHNWGNPCYWMVYNGNSYWNGWFGGTSPIYGNTHVHTVISPEFLEILFYTILCLIIYCLKPADQVSQWRLRQVGRQGANWKLELLRHLNPWVALVQRQSLQ